VAQGVVHPRLLETQRITDTLLEDFDNVDPAFYVWILAKRQLLHDRLTLALEALLASPNDPASASAAALALLTSIPRMKWHAGILFGYARAGAISAGR
jgi:DNA-binding SARP family transcriptional activator